MIAASFMLSMLYFNSIKVRLKPKFDGYNYVDNEFQFHKGTIKTYLHDTLSTRVRYFNSIKVRLKLIMMSSNFLQTIFQFHKGTIKTGVI